MEQQGIAPLVEETSLEPVRKIRAELNVEKWSIWRPAKSKTPPVPCIFRRTEELKNGDTVTRQVTVSVIDGETLTTEDQKTYYVLVEIWEANNRPFGQVPFSLSGIAKRLGKGWGTNSRDAITASLKRLRGVLLTWENAYYSAANGETLEMLDTVNTVSELKIYRKKRGEGINDERGYFRFSEHILANLRERHTKPVLLQVVLSFKSEIAQLIYTRVDRYLSQDITIYTKRTKELFEDLGLDGKAYVPPSKRKQVLVQAVAELQNTPLSNGFSIAEVTLERTADRKDWKLIVKRERARRKNDPIQPRSAISQGNLQLEENRPGEGCIRANWEPTENEQKGMDLVAYFLSVFYGAGKPTITPTQKHRELAAAIVANHGEVVSRYIVDFAKDDAKRTNFPIATFGAIANYVDRGVARYTLAQARVKREEEARREAAKKADADRLREARVQRGYELLRELPPAALQTLLAQKRAELITSEKWRDNEFKTDIFRTMFEKEAEQLVRQDLLAND